MGGEVGMLLRTEGKGRGAGKWGYVCLWRRGFFPAAAPMRWSKSGGCIYAMAPLLDPPLCSGAHL